MRTRFDGICAFCKKNTPKGHGHFQSISSLPKEVQNLYRGKNMRFIVRCNKCIGVPNIKIIKTT